MVQWRYDVLQAVEEFKKRTDDMLMHDEQCRSIVQNYLINLVHINNIEVLFKMILLT